MRRMVLLLAVGLVTTLGHGPLAWSAAPGVITGTLRSVKGQPLPGLVLLERGELHGNVWDGGGLAGPDGRFRIEVPGGGQYGLHAYASGYFYRPRAIMVEPGRTLTVDVVLEPEPTRERDPVIRRVEFATTHDLLGRRRVSITVEVADPDDDLGPQVMAFDARHGRAHAMRPPRRVRDLKANFPQGPYRLTADGAAGSLDPRDWHFVVADHGCWTSDILGFPHQPQPARVVPP